MWRTVDFGDSSEIESTFFLSINNNAEETAAMALRPLEMTPRIRGAADLLVATAILCGLVTHPENAIDEMVYKDLQNPDMLERGISLVGAPLSGYVIHEITNIFRRGKEAIL